MLHLRLPTCVQDVENIAALPVEAAQAEEMLREGANLLQVVGRGAVRWVCRLGRRANFRTK